MFCLGQNTFMPSRAAEDPATPRLEEFRQPPRTRSAPKSRAAVDGLRKLAVQLGAGGQLPTVAQLRREFSVSTSTLDGALGELENEGVLRCVRGSGVYVADGFKRAVVLICAPDFLAAGHSPFWDLLAEAAKSRARATGQDWGFHFAQPHADSGRGLHPGLLEDLERGRIQGVLAVGLSPEVPNWLAEQGVACVVFAGAGRYSVGLNYEAILSAGMETLAVRGCQRIAVWQPRGLHQTEADARVATAANAAACGAVLAAHGIPHHAEDWNLAGVTSSSEAAQLGGAPLSHREQGRILAERFFPAGSSEEARPDGLLLADDMMAWGALEVLLAHGLIPGRDIQVASHANRGSPVLAGFADRVIRVEVDPAAIVEAVFHLLEDLMAGREPAESVTRVGPAAVLAPQ